MKRFILFVALLTGVVAWALLIRPTFWGGPAGYIIVSGHSMEPTYFTGDLVITRRQGEYRVGDSVAFRVKDGNIIHRIVGGNSTSGFDTQGDNNAWVDAWKDGAKPTNDDIIGRAWLVIPGGSKYVSLAQNPGVLFGALVFVFTVGALGISRPSRRRSRVPGFVWVMPKR